MINFETLNPKIFVLYQFPIIPKFYFIIPKHFRKIASSNQSARGGYERP